MEKIDKSQLASMIVLFEVGSSSLFQLGSEADRDSWIAVLTGAGVGVMLLGMFLFIWRRDPGKNLFGLLQTYFGKWAGTVLAAMYVLYFADESMRNVRDFGDLMILSVLPQTPIFVVMLVMVLLSAYAVFQGVEVLFRLAELFLPWVLLGYGLLLLLFFSSDLLNAQHLFPVLEHGFKPVWKAAFPAIAVFPFGQMLLFLMFWNLLDNPARLGLVSAGAYAFTCLLLTVINAANLMLLGGSFAAASSIPLLQTTEVVEIPHLLQRLDPLVVLLMFAGLFFKSTLWYMGAVLGLSQLLKTGRRILVFPVGAIIYGCAFLEPNYPFHVWMGLEIMAKDVFPVFVMAIPAVLFLRLLVIRRSNPGSCP